MKKRWSSKFRKVAPLLAAATVAVVFAGPVAGSAANLSSVPFAVKAQNASEGSHYAIKPFFSKTVTPTPEPTTPAPTTAPTTPTPTPEPTPAGPDYSTRMTINTALSTCKAPFNLEINQLRTQPNAKINWGDGTEVTTATAGVNNHTYATKARYNIEIVGTLDGLGRSSLTLPTAFGTGSTSMSPVNCIESVDHFGEDSGITNLAFMFQYAQNIKSVAAPPSTVTNLSYMFNYARAFSANLNTWNTSKVTNFNGMFYGADAFNSHLNNWDVGSAKTMSYMFAQAQSFNGNIGNWRPVNATDMGHMFQQAYSLNQDLSQWTVGNVTNFTWMFWNTSAFNSSLGDWDIRKATDTSLMFGNTPVYNQNLSKWDVTAVRSKTDMFKGSAITAVNRPKGA